MCRWCKLKYFVLHLLPVGFWLYSIVSAAGPLLHINNANFLSLPFVKSDLSIYYLILSSTISVFITPQILNSKFEIVSNVFYNLLHYMHRVLGGIFHTSKELSLGSITWTKQNIAIFEFRSIRRLSAKNVVFLLFDSRYLFKITFYPSTEQVRIFSR
jgi:hypothetical protein